MPSSFEQFNQRLRGSLFLKMAIVGILVLILLIPSGMIQGLIRERQFRQQDVVTEVSSKWGFPQTITGPVLLVPYQKVLNNEKGEPQTTTEYAYFLPENQVVIGTLSPEFRRRGIYDVLLYRSDVTLSGNFGLIDFSEWKIPAERILWNEAKLLLGIPDLRGIEERVNLTFRNQSKNFEPGLPNKDILESGVIAPVDLSGTSPYTYSINLKLNGSDTFQIVPVGKETKVNLSGAWANPSFVGAFLPENSEISEKEFRASWNVLHLNREFPEKWTGSTYHFKTFPQNFSKYDEFSRGVPIMEPGKFSGEDAGSSAFGVRLLVGVDHYQKTERSAKYMILFVFLTFLVFFFVEVLSRRRIHPMQYLLVGFGLLIFYLLLLSLSEYVGFNLAYLIGSIATIGLISVYSLSVFHLRRLTVLLSGILVLLYGFLFVLLQLEDYALLLGSIALFVILAVIMFITRKVDWYKGEPAA